jgi:hypothetical protein
LNYCYLYVNKLQGQEKQDLFGQLKKSTEVLSQIEKNHGSVHLFVDPDDREIEEFSKKHGFFNKKIELSRNYNKDGKVSSIDILVEKIIQLKDFNENQDVVLLDVDTLFINSVPENYWTDDTAVLWSAEYYITQFRNLGNVLPYLPWDQVEIDYNNNFIMYNTGVVYIPKKHRKEICEKALWITDYLNNGIFDPNDRYGNRIDEQIGLSIAIHDFYSKHGKIKTCEQIIHHFWEEKYKTQGNRWWE